MEYKVSILHSILHGHAICTPGMITYTRGNNDDGWHGVEGAPVGVRTSLFQLRHTVL
jgi:hypothetical protein